MPQVKLTDKYIENRLRKTGNRYAVMDKTVAGFGVRVSERGKKTFVLRTRGIPGVEGASWRAIGTVGAIGLADAREKARDWIKLIGQGVDPKTQERVQRAAEQRRRDCTFAAVAADFAEVKLSRERRGAEVKREIERDLTPKIGNRPITEITRAEIAAIITAKARRGLKGKPAPAQARNLLATVKRLFQWAVNREQYGLDASPAAGLKPDVLCGEKVKRERVLTDDELRALWRASQRLGYPHGSVYRLLLLTGLRLNEGADAARSEINKRAGVWTIPANRMKGRNGKARAHEVPLTDEIAEIFANIPQFEGGDFLFSTTFGKSPTWVGHKIKVSQPRAKRKRDRKPSLDELMLVELRKIAAERGDDPKKVRLEPWRNHDIRRTVRSHLAAIKGISEEAREAVLAHAKPGIKGVYNQHDYRDEKREALTLWAQRLRSIVESESAPSNVVPMLSRA